MRIKKFNGVDNDCDQGGQNLRKTKLFIISTITQTACRGLAFALLGLVKKRGNVLRGLDKLQDDRKGDEREKKKLQFSTLWV